MNGVDKLLLIMAITVAVTVIIELCILKMTRTMQVKGKVLWGRVLSEAPPKLTLFAVQPDDKPDEIVVFSLGIDVRVEEGDNLDLLVLYYRTYN